MTLDFFSRPNSSLLVFYSRFAGSSCLISAISLDFFLWSASNRYCSDIVVHCTSCESYRLPPCFSNSQFFSTWLRQLRQAEFDVHSGMGTGCAGCRAGCGLQFVGHDLCVVFISFVFDIVLVVILSRLAQNFVWVAASKNDSTSVRLTPLMVFTLPITCGRSNSLHLHALF